MSLDMDGMLVGDFSDGFMTFSSVCHSLLVSTAGSAFFLTNEGRGGSNVSSSPSSHHTRLALFRLLVKLGPVKLNRSTRDRESVELSS